jgi:hypothetical protein
LVNRRDEEVGVKVEERVEERVEALEARTRLLEERLGRLERAGRPAATWGCCCSAAPSPGSGSGRARCPTCAGCRAGCGESP